MKKLILLVLVIALFVIVPGIQAESISYGQTRSGYLAMGRMQEWTFQGHSGDVVSIYLNAANNSWDPVLEVYAPSGYEIAYDDDVDYWNGNLNAAIEGLTLSENGTYVILVRSFLLRSGGNFTLTLASPNAPQAGPITGVVVQSTAALRIRSEPSTSGARIGNIPPGAQATVLAVDGNWAQINYEGIIGWASLDYLEVVQGTLPGETTTTAPVAPPTTGSNTIRSTAEVHIRAEPSRDAQSLAVVPPNTTATLLGSDPSGAWYQVQYGSITGWTYASWWTTAQ